MFFCVKQKTAYELRISDWSSDVCSSDLPAAGGGLLTADLLATDLVHVAPDLALGGVEHAGEDHEEDQHLEAGVLARLQLRLGRPHEEVGNVARHLVHRGRPAVRIGDAVLVERLGHGDRSEAKPTELQ